MSNNFFAQEDEDTEFRDIPDEVTEGQQAPPVSVRSARPAAPPTQAPVEQPTIMEEYEENPELDTTEDEEDFSAALTDARFRLEQGRLYEMIMNHNIFEGADADEKAIKYVQKQIRNFAKEQMEIMLGMRQEVAPVAQPLSAADFPFNDLEVQALKALASAATQGATKAPEAQTFSGAQVEAPKRVGLNPIAVKAQAKPAAMKPPQAKPQTKSPLPQKASTPIKRNPRVEAEIERILAEEGVSREEIERQYPPQYKPLTTDPTQMDPEDLAKRNAQNKTRRAASATALPMPTPEQTEMMYTSRAQAAASHPQMQTLMGLLLNKGKQ